MKIRRTFEVSIEHEDGATNDGQVLELLAKAVRYTFGQKHVVAVVRCGQPMTANGVLCVADPSPTIAYHNHVPGTRTEVKSVGNMTVITTVPEPVSDGAWFEFSTWNDDRFRVQLRTVRGRCLYRHCARPERGGDGIWIDGLPFSTTASIGDHDWRNISQRPGSTYNEQVCRKTGDFRYRLLPCNGGDEKWRDGLSPREHREWLLVAGGRPDIEEEVSIVTKAWRHRWKNRDVGPSEWVDGPAPR